VWPKLASPTTKHTKNAVLTLEQVRLSLRALTFVRYYQLHRESREPQQTAVPLRAVDFGAHLLSEEVDREHKQSAEAEGHAEREGEDNCDCLRGNVG
jgi:hypothetical protein